MLHSVVSGQGRFQSRIMYLPDIVIQDTEQPGERFSSYFQDIRVADLNSVQSERVLSVGELYCFQLLSLLPSYLYFSPRRHLIQQQHMT